MKRITIRLVDELAKEVFYIAKSKNISVNELIKEIAWDSINFWERIRSTRKFSVQIKRDGDAPLNLKARREKVSLTTKDVAGLLNISVKEYESIENGLTEPSIEIKEAISYIL